MSDFKAKAGRIARDVELALRGDYDDISEDTQKEIAEMLRDHLDGRSRVEIPINDRVTIEGRRERDGTVITSIKIDF